MKSLHEDITMPDRNFPIRAFIRSHRTESNIFVHPHWHDVVEILYFIEGTAIQQINNKIFEVNKNELVVIAGGQIHSTYTQKEDKNEILVIQFSPDFIDSENSLLPENILVRLFNFSIDFPNPISNDTVPGSEAICCIKNIYEELKNRNMGFEVFAKAYILKFVGIMVRNFGHMKRKSNDVAKLNDSKKMLKNTFMLIDSNFSSEITLEEAAKASNLSIPHFCRLFKSSTGMTFTEYLLLYRINRAEDMLRSGLTITEIACECGFNSLASFSRAFKKLRNLSPTEFRKKYL